MQWVHCLMDKKFVAWSHLQASGQQLSIPVDTRDKWCPSGVQMGTSVTITFVNDTDEGVECTLSKSARDTKLSSPLDTPKGQDATQSDLDKPEKWAHVNLMRLQQGQVQGAAPGLGQPLVSIMAGG